MSVVSIHSVERSQQKLSKTKCLYAWKRRGEAELLPRDFSGKWQRIAAFANEKLVAVYLF
jgi:hypothetical protein